MLRIHRAAPTSSKKKMTVLAHQPNKDPTVLAKLVESGKLWAIIDSTYTLGEAPEAPQRLGEGRVQDRVVIVP